MLEAQAQLFFYVGVFFLLTSKTVEGGGGGCGRVNGGWSGWYVSGSWSTSCGYGTLPLVRYCNNPSPSCGGSGCPGSGSGYNARSICCPGNGGWSGWSYSGSWSATCGYATIGITRSCNNPAPSCGGSSCPGSSSSSTSRSLCCPRNGAWTSWGSWAPWSPASCGNAQTRTRTRTCSNPAPYCGGASCSGSSSESSSKQLYNNCCSNYWGRSSDNTCQQCSTCATGYSLITACQTYADAVCRDITPPVVTLNPPNPQFLQGGTTWVDPGATAWDSADGTINVITRTPTRPNSFLLQPQNINYTAVDNAGNVGFAVRIVNVSDTLPPTLTLLGKSFVTVEAATNYTDPGCTASDLVDGSLSTTLSGVPINTHITGNYTVTCSACDLRTPPHCASVTRLVEVIQTIRPVITLLGQSLVYAEATFPYVDAGATVYDTLDTNLVPTVTFLFEASAGTWNPVASINTRILGTYKVVYNVRNSHGLTALPINRTVVVRDTLPPVLTLLGANPYLQQGAYPYVEPGYTAIDLLDGNDTSRVVVTGQNFNISAPAGTRFNITYTVSDLHGNEAPPKVRTIIIIDRIPPVLTLVGNATYYLQGSFPWHDPGATASDILYGDLTSKIVVGGQTVNSFAPAGTSFLVTYNVVNPDHLRAIQLNRTVTIIDTIPPIITLDGSTSVTHQGATPWIDPGYTAYDLLDGVLTADVIVGGHVNIMAPAGTSVVLSYNVHDHAGNWAIPRYRTVIEIDTIPPNITLYGNYTLMHEAATPWVDPGYWAWDTLDLNLTNRVIVTGSVNPWTPSGTVFVIWYNVSDDAGNKFGVSRTVNNLDTWPPNITLYGDSLVEHQGGTPYFDAGAWAWDLLDGNLTANITVTGSVDVYGAPWSNHTLYYNVHDMAGNKAITVTRTIMIIDTLPPVLTIIGKPAVEAEGGWPYMDLGAQGADLLDGNVTPNIRYNVTVVVPPNATSSSLTPKSLAEAGGLDIISTYAPLSSVYTVLYWARDRAGNIGTANRTVQIVDTLPPTLTVLGMEHVEVRVGSLYLDAGAEANDAYFGVMTSKVVVSVEPSCALVNITDSVGTKHIYYSVADALGHETAVEGRLVDVLPSPSGSIQETYSVVSLQLEMSVSTPIISSPIIGYTAMFVPQPGVSVSEPLHQAGIDYSFLECVPDGSYTTCIFEALTLTADELSLLRSNTTLVITASQSPVGIIAYFGSFTTTPVATPSINEATILLEQTGIVPINVSCFNGVCSFWTNTRPTTTSAIGGMQIHQSRRRRNMGTTEIDQLFVSHMLAPYLKRELLFTLIENHTISSQQLLSAMQAAQLQPSSINCINATLCIVHTFDPVLPRQLALLTDTLSESVQSISDSGYFVKVEGSLTMTREVSLEEVQLSLLQAGFPVWQVFCNSTSMICTFETYSDVQTNQINTGSFPNYLLNVVIGVNRESPMPTLPYGQLETVLVVKSNTNVSSALSAANITGYQGLTCTVSTNLDNAWDCTFLVSIALNNSQIALLLNQSGVLSVSPSQNVTLPYALQKSLMSTVERLVDVSPDRLVFVSLDPGTGVAILKIMPDTSLNSRYLMGTMWASSLTVVGYDSISDANATALLLSCDVNVATVNVVNGTLVRFQANNISIDHIRCLTNNTHINPDSIGIPLISFAAKTHEEAANLLVWYADNNMLVTQVSDRIFWAIPGTASAANAFVNPNALSSASTGSSSSTSSMLIIIIAAGAGAVAFILIVLLIVRRRRSRVDEKAANVDLSSDPNRHFSLNRSSSRRSDAALENKFYGSSSVTRGVSNPLFDEPREGAYSDAGRNDKEVLYGFTNPLYAGNVADHVRNGGNAVYDHGNDLYLDNPGAAGDGYLMSGDGEGQYDVITPIQAGATQNIYGDDYSPAYERNGSMYEDAGYLDVSAKAEDVSAAHEAEIGDAAEEPELPPE